MKLNTSILFVALSLFFVSCKNDTAKKKFDKLEKMQWLLGDWKNKLPEGDLSESWEKKDDSTFVGQSYFIKGKDTLSYENIELIQKGQFVYYIPTVKGQNNDKPVTFNLTTATEKEFTFENPTHDYPQKITYKKVNDTSLVATISGMQQGKASSESYPMTRK